MKKLVTFSLLLFAMPALAAEIDIEARTKRALEEYKDGNIGKSADVYEEIFQYLKSLKTQNLSSFLPTAPLGWTDNPIPDNASAAAALTRQTTKLFQKDNESAKLSFVSDNKLMNAISALITLAANVSESGEKIIKDYSGFLYKFEQNKETGVYILNFFVSDKLMVEVVGDDLTEATALQFVKKIDLAKLKEASLK